MENRSNQPDQPAQMETPQRAPATEQRRPAGIQTPPANDQPNQQEEPAAQRQPAPRNVPQDGSESRATQLEQQPQNPNQQDDQGMDSVGLLPYHEADGYRRRWEQIQATFVDDPKLCCEQADALVIEVLQRMSQMREEHRANLRGALDQGGDTEGLRQAMQQYRAFFSGLLKS